MDPLITMIIATVSVVLSVAVFAMLMRMLKTTGELKLTVEDRAAKSQELEHVKAQLESVMEDANATQELRVKVGTLESELAAAQELAKRANELAKSLEARRDELQMQMRELTAIESGLRADLKGANESLTATKSRNEELESELGRQRQRAEDISIREGGLKKELAAVREQLAERDDFVKQAKDSFKVLSSETLDRQQKTFRETAEASLKVREEAVEKLVKPLSERIERLDKARVDSSSALQRQIELLTRSKDELATQAERLSSALKYRPEVRGQWGEMQVESALQLGGLVKGKNYFAQQKLDDGLRPDFIVKMPHGRDLAIDSKVPLNAYLEAENAEDVATRDAALVRHAVAVRQYAGELASKAYHSQLPSSIDYTVMVIPEFAIAPAEQRDPDLVVRALQQNVLITTHSNLVALVSTVALGWKEHQIHQEASNVAELAVQLHDRLTVYVGHVVSVGKSLDDAVKRYNKSVGSLEHNVLTSANRFPALGVPTTKTMPNPQPIESSSRPITKIAPKTDDEVNPNGALEAPEYTADYIDDEPGDLFLTETRELT